MISTKTVAGNPNFSICGKLDHDSNVIEEGDLHSEKFCVLQHFNQSRTNNLNQNQFQRISTSLTHDELDSASNVNQYH
jgi:hypothetical protein